MPDRGVMKGIDSSVARPDPVLSVRNLHVDFVTDSGWVNVVDDVSFDVGDDEIVGLVGESGSGKSVTAMSILRLIPIPPGRIRSGSVMFGGDDLLSLTGRELNHIRGNNISMVFQEPQTSLNPAFTVGEQIAEVVRRHRDAGRKAAWDRAVQMLDRVGIPSARQRARDYPHAFSGGMRQRVGLAIALACNPKVLIADEPTTALDVTVQSMVLDLILDLQEEFGMAVLFITHDLSVVAELCERVVVMYAGQVVEQSRTEELFRQPFHPYTEGLMKSMPHFSDADGHLLSIPGTVPPPGRMPVGCRFHPRCEYAENACTIEDVILRSDGDRLARCLRSDELALDGVE